MDAAVAKVVELLEDFARTGSVKPRQPVGAEFEAVAVVLSRGEPKSGVAEDIADNAPYLDSVSDTHVLLALPALAMESGPSYTPPSRIKAEWYSQDEASRRWRRLLEFAGKEKETRRDELKGQLARSANQLRINLFLSDYLLPGILFAIRSEKLVVHIRVGENILKTTELFAKLKESYTLDPDLPLSWRLRNIALDAGMKSASIRPPDIIGFEDWSGISYDKSWIDDHLTTRRTIG